MEIQNKCRATGKVRFPDPGAAKEAIVRIKSTGRFYDHIQGRRRNRRAGKPGQCRYYYCKHCHGWHLTSLEQSTSLRKHKKDRRIETEDLLLDAEQAAEWKKNSIPFPNIKPKQMIIGINGYSGSGKDTVGKLIQIASCKDVPEGVDLNELVNQYHALHEWWIEEQSGWEIKKWAGKLKTIASLLTGIPVEKFEDQEFKKTNLGPQWDHDHTEFIEQGVYKTTRESMSVRTFLQKLGTDGLRIGLHENTWVNALMADYEGLYDIDTDRTTWPKWIITDTRFPNEAKAIKDAGGIVIRVDRPGVSAINAHPSETALDNWEFDYKIMNGSDLTSLLFTVGSILRKENLL